MTETFKPARPTEYDGVVFRSKSEAIFARAMDLRGGLIWEYDPKFHACDGWGPDFLIAGKNNEHRIQQALVEYKPSITTNTYLAELHDRFAEVLPDEFLGILACGNSFNLKRQTFEWMRDGSWKEWDFGLFRNIEEAATYRFDLKQE